MESLLSGLNDSFFNAVPSPDPSPVKPAPSRHRTTPNKPKSRPVPPSITPEDVDMAALVDGAENWDWDDMESDFLTPKKKQNCKVSVEADPAYIRETCTRCIVEKVVDAESGGRYEKVCAFIH